SQEVMSGVEPIIKPSNLSVVAKVQGRVPALKSDRQKVKQIVLNLLSNALKFTPRGSVTIRASYDGRTRMVHIAVRDTGVGITGDDRLKVIEDFRQLEGSSGRRH